MPYGLPLSLSGLASRIPPVSSQYVEIGDANASAFGSTNRVR